MNRFCHASKYLSTTTYFPLLLRFTVPLSRLELIYLESTHYLQLCKHSYLLNSRYKLIYDLLSLYWVRHRSLVVFLDQSSYDIDTNRKNHFCSREGRWTIIWQPTNKEVIKKIRKIKQKKKNLFRKRFDLVYPKLVKIYFFKL